MKRIITLLLATTALCLLSIPSLAADIPLGDVLMGKVAPLTIKLGDVTPQWSQFSLSPEKDQATDLPLMLIGLFPRLQFVNTYFTKGETISSEGGTFLLAYSKPVAPMIKNFSPIFDRYSEIDLIENIMSTLAVDKDTPLNLCLLNLKTLDIITDIHPANPQQDILDSNDILKKSLSSHEQKANDSTLKANLQILRNAIEMFHADVGRYPKHLRELYETPSKSIEKDYKGPYVKAEGAVIVGTCIPVNPYTSSTNIHDHWSYNPANGVIEPNMTGKVDAEGNSYTLY